MRKKGAVRVALITPYGATKTSYFAVSKDLKFDAKGRVVEGLVGHDRIQQGSSESSIGESIRFWYGLPKGDFERIDVEIEIVDDSFYVTPLTYKTPSSSRSKNLPVVEHSLTFTRDYVSKFWKDQIQYLRKAENSIIDWSFDEIGRIMQPHRQRVPHIQESDLLRASGPLKHLGISLGPYVGRGYDCYSEFCFMGYPGYQVPVEIKKSSKDFKYQMQKYGKDELSRAVILCAHHDLPHVHHHIDIIELDALTPDIHKL